MTHHVLLYPVMSSIRPSCIYGAMFGWDVPLRVDPLLAMFLFYTAILTFFRQVYGYLHTFADVWGPGSYSDSQGIVVGIQHPSSWALPGIGTNH